MSLMEWDDDAWFWRQVERRGHGGCWVWTGARDSDGYGRYATRDGTVAAHRETYRLRNPDYVWFGRLIHTCGNRACVNPAQLEEQAEVDWERRFWSKVRRGGPAQCWEWTGARSADGYGVLRVEGRTRYAHRLAGELARRRGVWGPVTHTCGNRACVNPAHLEEGAPNNAGRLDEEDVEEIMDRAARGEPQSSIAARFRVSRSMISRILSRDRWKYG